MENNLEVIENIMKPYFDKKEEIANKYVDIENEKKELQIELENLRVKSKVFIEDFKEKQEQEIEEYINKAMNTESNFFTSYGSMLRKDLEIEYNKSLEKKQSKYKLQEEKLISKIEALNSIKDGVKLEKQRLEELYNKLNEKYNNQLKKIENDFRAPEERSVSKVNLDSIIDIEISEDEKDLTKISDFTRVDLREMVEIKNNLRKELNQEQKRLNFELRQEQINFDTIMLRLSSFNYEYDENHQVINSDDWKALYTESNKISNKISELKTALKKIEEYFNIIELTQEESKAIMMPMTPWERKEYDRRKAVNKVSDELNKEVIEIGTQTEIITENDIDFIISEPEEVEEKEENIIFPEIIDEPEKDYIDIEEFSRMIDENINNTYEYPNVESSIQEDIVQINDSVVSYGEEINGNVVVDDIDDLMKTIYNDIVKETNYVSTIKINPSKGDLYDGEYYVSTKFNNENYILSGIVDLSKNDLKLPCGEYVNEEDINDAVDRYFDKNKGITYIVKESEKEYKVTNSTIKKFKKKLKKCAQIKYNYFTNTLFGKEWEKSFESEPIGVIDHSEIPSGEYISKKELIFNMKNLFSRNKLPWLRKISNILKTQNNTNDYEETIDEINDVKIK